MTLHSTLSPSRRLFISRILVLIIGTLLSVSVFWYVNQHQREQAIFELKVVAQERTVALAQDSGNLTTAILTLQNLMANAPAISFERFAGIANIFLRQYPEIRALEWAPRSTQNDLGALVRQAKREAIEPFHLHNQDASISELKSYEDGQFLPILYQVAAGKTPHAPGFDLLSVGLFRDEIRQAIQENRPVISRPFGEQDPAGRQALTRLFAPVYQPGSTTEILGIVSMVIDTRRFIENASNVQMAQPVPFEIYDQEDHNKLPLYHWPPDAVFSSSSSEAERHQQTIPFFDHEWRVIHLATEQYVQHFQNFLPVSLVVISMAFTLALYLVIRFAQTRTDHAFALSNEKFWQLEQANKLLNNKVIEKSTFERSHKELQERLNDYLAISDGYFWELDQHYRFTFVSRRVMQVTGFPASALLGARITENLYEADAEELKKLMEKSIPAKRLFTLDVRFLAQKKRWRWERLNGKPVFDEAGAFCGFRGISQDISLLKLRDQEETLVLEGNELFHGENAKTGMTHTSDEPEEGKEFPESDNTPDAAELRFTERHVQTLALLKGGFTQAQQDPLIRSVGQLLIDSRQLGFDQIAHEAEQVMELLAEEEGAAVHLHIEALETQLQSVLSKLIDVD